MLSDPNLRAAYDRTPEPSAAGAAPAPPGAQRCAPEPGFHQPGFQAPAASSAFATGFVVAPAYGFSFVDAFVLFDAIFSVSGLV